jgi:hypothetical protein
LDRRGAKYRSKQQTIGIPSIVDFSETRGGVGRGGWNKDVPMRGRKSSLKIVLSHSERTALEHVTRSTSVAAGLARRARIVLLVTDGAALSDCHQPVSDLCAEGRENHARRHCRPR